MMAAKLLITIFPIPALKDNYIWMIADAENAWVIDPGEAAPVIEILVKQQLTLKGILITHHHPDHSGGVPALLEYTGKIPVYGSYKSKLSFITDRVRENDKINLLSMQLNVLEIPGHTLDHVAYYDKDTLFCGDTLFSGGCGRVFEGTYEEMYHSLNKLFNLNNETKIYCGHEYTLSNLAFALKVEPHNIHLISYIEKIKERISKTGCSLPSSLENEKNINPFLRCTIPEVIQSVQHYTRVELIDPAAVFRALREWKNNAS